MTEETEKEKPKFVCKLCKLDYPSSVQFEEHLWSMLHHKAINNKSSSTKHHCHLCMFESFDLNAYGKHLIGEQHKLSLEKRRKRLEEPCQAKATTPATSCSKKSESQTVQSIKQRAKSSRWGTPTHPLPNQSGFNHGGLPQNQGQNQSGFNNGGYFQNQGPNQSGFNNGGFSQHQGPNQSGFNNGSNFQNQGQNQSGFNNGGYFQNQGPNQSGFNIAGYAQNQVLNTFLQALRSNTELGHQENFIYNQGEWQNPHHPYSWNPPHGRFGQSSVGSWENNSPFNPRQRFSPPSQAGQQHQENSTNGPDKPKAQCFPGHELQPLPPGEEQHQEKSTITPGQHTTQFTPGQRFPTTSQAGQQQHEKSINRPGKHKAQFKLGKRFPRPSQAGQHQHEESTNKPGKHKAQFDHGQRFPLPSQAGQQQHERGTNRPGKHKAQFNPGQRFPTPSEAGQKSTNDPGKPSAQGKVSKKKASKNEGHWKNNNVTSKVKIRKAHHPVASKGSSAQGCPVKKPNHQQVPAGKALSAKKDMQSESVPNVKVSGGPTPSKKQKQKKQKTPSPQIKPNGHPEQTGRIPKPNFKSKGKKNKRLNSFQNQSSAASVKSPMKQAVKESIEPTQSSRLVSTKQSAQYKDIASSTTTFPKATSMVNRFEQNLREALHGKETLPKATSMVNRFEQNLREALHGKEAFPKATSMVNRFEQNLREALHGKESVHEDEVGEVTSSDLAGVSRKVADDPATPVKPSSPIVSSSATGSLFQFAQEQYRLKKEKSCPKAHSCSSFAKNKQTFKCIIHHQKESVASSTETSVAETAAGRLPTLETSATSAVSSFHSLHEQNGKWSAEIRCASSSDKLVSKTQSQTETTGLDTSDKLASKIHSDSRSSGTSTSEKTASNTHGHTESSSMGVSDIKPTSSFESNKESSSTGMSDKSSSNIHSPTKSVLDKPKSNSHGQKESSITSTSDKPWTSFFNKSMDRPMFKVPSRTKSLSTGTSPENETYTTQLGTKSLSTDTSDKPTSITHGHTESLSTDTSVQIHTCRNLGPSSSTFPSEDSSKALVRCKSEETGSNESSTTISNLARSSSSPAAMITVASQSKEMNAGNQPLLSQVLVNEQQKQKMNPRPNLTNARSRLRTNKDAEHPTGGQLFKEKIQGLLSDVAKPVWQQKKLRMMLAKAKKTPDRFNRFSHLASSPSHSEDPMESLDIMNLSTEFQQELLDLIESEDADLCEEDILSQLTASEATETFHESSHTVGTATPVSIEQQSLQAMMNSSHAAGSLFSAPVIKQEPLYSTELMDFHGYQPSLGSEQLQYEERNHPGLIGSCAMPEERGSAPTVFNQEVRTFGDLDNQALGPSQPYKELNHPGLSASVNPEEGGGPLERHDANVTSTSTIPSMTVDPGSREEITRVHKDKKKKSKKSKSKEKDPSPSKKAKKISSLEKSPMLKASKLTSSRRKSVQSSLLVNRTKSPAVLTANKLKEKLKQKRRMPDTTAGDMNNLLEITLQENQLQAKMDKLTAKIDKVTEIIHEKEAKLKRYKQQKDTFLRSLGDLRETRLNLLLGLTSGEKSDSSLSENNRDGIKESPSSSTTTRDLVPAEPRASLQVDRHQADSSNAAQSGGEGGIKISNVTSMASSTPSHRTEPFRIMFGSPARPGGDQGHGLMDIFRDAGGNQDEQRIATGSPNPYAGQNIEMVPQVMSRESLAKTLQELQSSGSGVTVDILSDEETLYGLGRERLRHPEPHPPNSDMIGAVTQVVRGPERDSAMQMYESTVEPYKMAVGSDKVQALVQRDGTEHRAEESSSLQSDLSFETTLKRIKEEPQDHHDIDQPLENLARGEPSLTKQKRLKDVSEESQTKRRKLNSKDPVMSKVKQECETSSSISAQEQDGTPIPQMENTSQQFPPYLSGSKDNNSDNPSKSSSSPRVKGYVINMCIFEDKLYACISDSRFIIFNLTTNKIDAEEDLALGNIKFFELWRDTTASKMVAFASDGSKNVVQFNALGNEFLQTLVLGRDVTCLHVKFNTLYAGLVNGEIASINIQKSKVSWYYDCTPTYAVTAISSTLEGGMALLITASEDRTVTIRRAEDGLLIRSLDGHLDVVTHIQVLGCFVMSMARNSTILIHNLETGAMILRVKHQTKIACCVMSGDTLAMAGHSGNVYYYKIENGKADIFDTGCGNITCMTTSQDMLFLGIRDGFIDVIPLNPSTVYKCEWNHCISRFLRLDALKTHLQLIHIKRSARQCLWRSCLKNYPQKNTSLKTMEQHVFSHLQDLGKQ